MMFARKTAVSQAGPHGLAVEEQSLLEQRGAVDDQIGLVDQFHGGVVKRGLIYAETFRSRQCLQCSHVRMLLEQSQGGTVVDARRDGKLRMRRAAGEPANLRKLPPMKQGIGLTQVISLPAHVQRPVKF